MAAYLFQVILFQAIFLIVYKIWLQKETFFNANRIYLLFTPFLALFLPFLEVEMLKETVSMPSIVKELPAVFIGDQPQEITMNPVIENQTDISLQTAVFWLYGAGFLISLWLFCRKYAALSRYFRFRKSGDKQIITIPNSTAAFTFLNTIFLGDKINTLSRKEILAHEQVHVKQLHSCDLLVFEVLRIVFWFNPVIYLYQKNISELHEFVADKQAAAQSEKKQYYNQLLNTAFGTERISFINTFFNQSLIKKRIVMLQKKSAAKASLKYFILLPLFVGMITYVSCTSDSDKIIEEENASLNEQLAQLEITLDNIDSLSDDERENLRKVLAKAIDQKTNVQITQEAGKATTQDELTDVPFAVVDEIPTFPGCEGLDNEGRKKCMSEHISSLVNQNFDTSLGEKLGLKGVNRIYVRFKIDTNGEIADIGVRGPHPVLEEEAKRVINLIPKMNAGKQRGKPVNVMYSLPIVFQVAE
tara:strand:- start:46727 stop:48145 length:1419 start_codon:yes stop_codon:yes gene_type:complete